MILVFGSINIDLVARVATIPRPGETVLAAAYSTLFGGKGANQAVAAARVAGAGIVRMAGRVGEDAFGRLCRDNLASNGVVVEDISTDTATPTGCAFIVVDRAGENAITVASGANAELAASALPLTNDLDPLVAVFQMEVPLAASLTVARAVKAAGGVVIWNLAPAPESLSPAQLRDILATTDHFVVNEIEALAASTLLGHGSDDFEAAAGRLAREGAATCIVTAGSKGAFAFACDGGRFHTPALAIEPVDTTGAGDAFVGILAACLHQGDDVTRACRAACRGASLSCLKLGAQASMPDLDELKNVDPVRLR